MASNNGLTPLRAHFYGDATVARGVHHGEFRCYWVQRVDHNRDENLFSFVWITTETGPGPGASAALGLVCPASLAGKRSNPAGGGTSSPGDESCKQEADPALLEAAVLVPNSSSRPNVVSASARPQMRPSFRTGAQAPWQRVVNFRAKLCVPGGGMGVAASRRVGRGQPNVLAKPVKA